MKYLITGEMVEVLATTTEGLYVAQHLTEDPYTGEQFPDGPISLVRDLYDKPPVYVLESHVRELRKEIVALQDEKSRVLKESREIQQQREALLTKLKNYKALKHIEEFIDGKITHFVVLDHYAKILTPEEAARAYYPYDRGAKLLTLFGDSKGDLTWGLNRYRDGSGSYDTVVPCLGYEAALQELQKYLDGEFAAESKYFYKSLVQAADKYGLQVPDAYREGVAESERASLRKSLEEAKAKVAKLEEELSES